MSLPHCAKQPPILVPCTLIALSPSIAHPLPIKAKAPGPSPALGCNGSIPQAPFHTLHENMERYEGTRWAQARRCRTAGLHDSPNTAPILRNPIQRPPHENVRGPAPTAARPPPRSSHGKHEDMTHPELLDAIVNAALVLVDVGPGIAGRAKRGHVALGRLGDTVKLEEEHCLHSSKRPHGHNQAAHCTT